jgi:hypothetical protein
LASSVLYSRPPCSSYHPLSVERLWRWHTVFNQINPGLMVLITQRYDESEDWTVMRGPGLIWLGFKLETINHDKQAASLQQTDRRRDLESGPYLWQSRTCLSSHRLIMNPAYYTTHSLWVTAH